MFDGLTIDRCSGKPVSLQIAQYVRCKIADSDLLPGEKFPTTQDFGRQIGVGPHTVRQAMKHLEQEGLVKSTPRLGTVVCDRAFEIVKGRDHDSVESAVNFRKLNRIGIVGLIQDVGNQRMRYCVETAEGIAQECERLGIMAILLPNMIINMSAEQIFEELVRVECQGLIWAHNSLPKDETVFDYISQRGIKVIFRRRCQGNDGRPCIDVDYESAGYRTGQYFYSLGIKELLVFSHFDFNTADLEPTTYAYPTRIKPGIVRAFEHNYLKPDIDVHVHRSEDEQVSERIYNKLVHTPASKGIIFTNGYQLLNYLCHTGSRGEEVLREFKTVAISNLTINYKLRPYVSGLDLMVLVDNFKETGRLLVGNLMGMLDGYFDCATTTLVNVDFVKFSDSFNGI